MRFHLDGFTVWVVCFAVIASSPIAPLPLLFVSSPMSNDEVTDRRVNWQGRRQRIRHSNGHRPRRFGGLNGYAFVGPSPSLSRRISRTTSSDALRNSRKPRTTPERISGCTKMAVPMLHTASARGTHRDGNMSATGEGQTIASRTNTMAAEASVALLHRVSLCPHAIRVTSPNSKQCIRPGGVLDSAWRRNVLPAGTDTLLLN